MIFRPLQPHVTSQLAQTNASGISSGCPFCMARERKELVPSDQIVLLAGSRAGHTFKIVPQEDTVFADYYAEDLTTPVNGFWTIHAHSDMYLKFPLPAIPGWALPLGVEDNCIIDDVLMRIVSSSSDFGTEGFDLQKLQHLICFVWQHRLPVTPIELVRFIEAHGYHRALSSETETLIKFGLDLLLWSHSRPPIKRRRINPFSQFRYAKNYRSDERHMSDWLYGPSINYHDLLKVQ